MDSITYTCSVCLTTRTNRAVMKAHVCLIHGARTVECELYFFEAAKFTITGPNEETLTKGANHEKDK